VLALQYELQIKICNLIWCCREWPLQLFYNNRVKEGIENFRRRIPVLGQSSPRKFPSLMMLLLVVLCMSSSIMMVIVVRIHGCSKPKNTL
jgi:hypothetical protein